jgi:phage portal protein BeeE
MNETSALQIVAVLACVGMLADAVATLPLFCYERLGPVRRPIDPPPPLVERPFVEITRQDWLSQLMVSLALRGNAYGQIVERGPWATRRRSPRSIPIR